MRVSRLWRCSVVAVAGASALVLIGCAPRQLSQGVPYVTAKHKVADAKFQRVRNYPCLRLDAVTADGLRQAQHTDEPEVLRRRAGELLKTAHADALASTRNELDRLDDRGWRELNRRYRATDAVPGPDQREQIWEQFVIQTTQQYQTLLAVVSGAQPRDIQRLLERIDRSTDEAVKHRGRLARAAPWFVFTVPSLLAVHDLHAKEYRGSQEQKLSSAICFVPDVAASLAEQEGGAASAAEQWVLVQRFAPMILQEQPASAPPYDPSIDRFGRVVAENRERIVVDASRPTVYAYARDVHINGADHVQLIYTHWFPAHPRLKGKLDPERGHLEGITLRITLDRHNEPAIFETVYNCGCYHRLYPTRALESGAAGEFGRPQPGKQFATERNVRWKIDMIVPKVVQPASEAVATRPLVRSKAGWHGLVDVALTEMPPADETAEVRVYELRPYDELERLPLPDGRGYTSMFDENGLVRGAQRLEGIFFTPIGILNAGQPRQRGTQLIHWDHWDFDDPHLFERTLRLPSDF